MDSLRDLKDFFTNNEISIKKYNGWSLTVGKDTWTLLQGVFYKNNVAQNLKDKTFISNYKRNQNNDAQSTKIRKWRGISCRRNRGDGNNADI